MLSNIKSLPILGYDRLHLTALLLNIKCTIIIIKSEYKINLIYYQNQIK